MQRRSAKEFPFALVLAVITGTYVLLVASILAADVAYLFAAKTSGKAWWASLADPYIQHSIVLTLVATTVTSVLSVLVAVPAGYLMSRYTFRGKSIVELLLDVPFVLPPLVVGLSLLVLFQFLPQAMQRAFVYQVPGVVLAQFVVACAFAVRIMRTAFDQIDPRLEQVALTLGCTRGGAFRRVAVPEALPGIVAAGTMAWARAIGEFGPLLVFAGATRGKTEVMATSVYLELSVGNLQAAVAVSLLMVVAAAVVLLVVRAWGPAGRS